MTISPIRSGLSPAVICILPFLAGSALAQVWDVGEIPEPVIETHVDCMLNGIAAPDRTVDGSWLQVRRDRKLTGRIGEIVISAPWVPHGYSYEYLSLDDPEWAEGQAPHESNDEPRTRRAGDPETD